MRHVLPAEQVGQVLRDARSAGGAFDAAWLVAVSRAVDSLSDTDREDWRAALNSTREAWGSAWDHRPATRAQRALALVADASDRMPIPEHECAHCGDELADDKRRGPPRLYCSARCRRDAHIARAA